MRTSAESIIHVWITSYFKQQLYVELYLLFAILGRVHMFNSNILHIWLFTLTNVVGITNRPYIWRGYNLWYWGRLNTLVFVTELSYDWLYPIKKCSKAILGTWQMSRCASSDEQATRRDIGLLPFQKHREQQTEYNLVIFHKKWLHIIDKGFPN